MTERMDIEIATGSSEKALENGGLPDAHVAQDNDLDCRYELCRRHINWGFPGGGWGWFEAWPPRDRLHGLEDP